MGDAGKVKIEGSPQVCLFGLSDNIGGAVESSFDPLGS